MHMRLAFLMQTAGGAPPDTTRRSDRLPTKNVFACILLLRCYNQAELDWHAWQISAAFRLAGAAWTTARQVVPCRSCASPSSE